MDRVSILAAVEAVWYDCEFVGLRVQIGAETKTKLGTKLRASSEWVDGHKTARKLSGTAAFIVRTLSQLNAVLDVMERWNYTPQAGDRLVVIGSDEGANGHDMPEPFAVAIKGAKLLAVVA